MRITAIAALAALPVTTARAVVFYDTGDPTKNTTAPTGSLANSGWQYEVRWVGGFLATPIAPNYFLAAKHVGGGVGSTINIPGDPTPANVVSVQTFGEDLNVYKIDRTFYSYAPLYDNTIDHDETGKDLVIIGTGGPRYTEVHVNNDPSQPLLGWNWKPNQSDWDFIERWGQNKVAAVVDQKTAGDQRWLAATFDRPGHGDSTGTNEAGLIGGDSSGGVFVNVNGVWKLDGINFGVDNFSFTKGGPLFGAALFDTRGLYVQNGTSPISGADDVPSAWYASRVGGDASTIKGIVNLPPTWNVDASSTWTTGSNWANGTPGNTAGAEADFRYATTADRTVTLLSNQTVGTLDFDNTNRYTLTGNTIVLQTNSGNARINVASGNHTIASAMKLNSDLDVNVINPSSTLTLSGGMTVSGKAITQIGAGTVEYKNVVADTLNVQQGKARILANGSNTSKVTTLSLANGTTLDLTNNDLVINSGTEAGWEALIKNGFNGGSWNGTGITSSTAVSSNRVTGLGIATAAQALSFNSGTKMWSGQTVTPSSILIKYTYVGDVNLDGVINGDDYFQIDQGFASHASGYANGDLDFNGKIDGDDYFWIDSNYSRQNGVTLSSSLAAPQGVSAVPEPATFGLVGTALAWVGLRRRRSCRSR